MISVIASNIMKIINFVPFFSENPTSGRLKGHLTIVFDL